MIVLAVNVLAASGLPMAKLLALDQASRTSGYAIFADGELVEHGKFTFEDSDFGDRLYKIRKQVLKLIDLNNIDEVAFEDIQLQENVETFKKLAEVFGVIYEWYLWRGYHTLYQRLDGLGPRLHTTP